MAGLTINVQRSGNIRPSRDIMTSTADIGDGMVRNWMFLDTQKVNPDVFGPENFPYTPEQERMAEKAFADAFSAQKYPIPEGMDIADYIFIGDESINELYAKHEQSYDKLFPSKQSFMEMAVYAEALKRDKAISFVNPNAVTNNDYIDNDAIMIVKPQVNDVSKRGFFGSIWNRIKSIFGAAGTERALNSEYNALQRNAEAAPRERDIANKFGKRNGLQTEALERQRAQAQAERDEIQKSYITQMVNLSPLLVSKDFFGELTDADFRKDKSSLGKDLVRNSSRVNVARLYMLSKGYSIEDTFSPDEKMAEARRAVGRELMEKVNTGDLDVHAEICAQMFKKLLDNDIYPQMNLTDDRSIVDAYTNLRVVDSSFLFFGDTLSHADLTAAINAKLTPDENERLHAKVDSLITVLHGPLNERYKMIRSDEYSSANEGLKNDFYRIENRNPVAPDLDRLQATDQLLGEYQRYLNAGQNISQLVADRNVAMHHHGDVYAQAEHELQNIPVAEREKAQREYLKVNREVAINERRDVSREFTGNRQPQRLTENQKARNNPQKENSRQPL